MPKLVNLESSQADNWQLLELESEIPADTNASLLPLESFLVNVEKLDQCGVWLSSADDIYALEPHLSKVSVVAFRFESFMDGRGFSQARILREHLDYKGQVRAIGQFIQDQLHYLLRCGFNEFSVADDADEDSLRESLADFSESYQAGCDVPAPLFRRRA